MAVWAQWAHGNEAVGLREGEKMPPKWPRREAFAVMHLAEEHYDADVRGLLDDFVSVRVHMAESIQQHLPEILRNRALRDRLVADGTLPGLARRIKRETLRLQRRLYPDLRSRGKHTSAQTLAFVFLWLTQLRLEWLAEQVSANVESRMVHVQWRGDDFDLVADAGQRLCASQKPLAEYDFQLLDTTIKLARQTALLDVGLGNVQAFAQYWRALWHRFIAILDAADGTGEAVEEADSVVQEQQRRLAELLMLPPSSSLLPAPAAAAAPLVHTVYTEPRAQQTDVAKGFLPEALPFARGNRRMRLIGLLQCEVLHRHVTQLLDVLTTWDGAAVTKRRIDQVLVQGRAASAAVIELVSLELVAQPNAALIDAMAEEMFKVLPALFLMSGDVELWTLKQLFGDQSLRIDAIHDDPYAGHVLNDLRYRTYETMTTVAMPSRLWKSLIEDVWTKGAQSIADGPAHVLEPVANAVLVELLQHVLVDNGCPLEWALKANGWFDFIEVQSKTNHSKGLRPPTTPTMALGKASARCFLLHVMRRNFIVVPSGAADGAPLVLNVPTFPAAVVTWFAFARPEVQARAPKAFKALVTLLLSS